MNITELKEYASDFQARREGLRNEAREKLHKLLAAVKGNEIICEEETLGYVLYENLNDEWVEAPIHAIRLDKNGTLQMTSELDYDDDNKPCVRDWDNEDRELTFDEYDHYCIINWPLTLKLTLDYLLYYPELFGEAATSASAATPLQKPTTVEDICNSDAICEGRNLH